MDDDLQKEQMAANLRNPKNRFLGFFCHAKEVDNSWGCDWSFATGVIIFSLVIGVASLADIYTLAKHQIFSVGSEGYGFFKFMFAVKVIVDLISLIDIGIACYAVNRENLTFSIVSYWVMVLCFLLNSIFVIYILIAMFIHWNEVYFGIIQWGVYEFGLLLFCWILFCNQVYLGRKKRQAQTPQSF